MSNKHSQLPTLLYIQVSGITMQSYDKPSDAKLIQPKIKQFLIFITLYYLNSNLFIIFAFRKRTC